MTTTARDGTEESERAPAAPEPQYLTGVGGGSWHAISRESMAYLRRGDVDSVAFAECGELVRVAAKYGAYSRTDVPVIYNPCHLCAWQVAAAGGEAAMQAEADRLRPTSDTLPSFDAVMADSFIAVNACRAILAAAAADGAHYDLEHGATLQLLATVAEHAPVLLVEEQCAEGECEHRAEGEACPGPVACAACSLQEGDWAGEWQGQFRRECTIPAPCAVLLALAEHAGVPAPKAAALRDAVAALYMAGIKTGDEYERVAAEVISRVYAVPHPEVSV